MKSGFEVEDGEEIWASSAGFLFYQKQ